MTENDHFQHDYRKSELLLLAEKAVLRHRLLEINRELRAGRKGKVDDLSNAKTHRSTLDASSPIPTNKQKQKLVMIDPRQMLLAV